MRTVQRMEGGKPATWTSSSNPIVKAYFELMNEVFGMARKSKNLSTAFERFSNTKPEQVTV